MKYHLAFAIMITLLVLTSIPAYARSSGSSHGSYSKANLTKIREAQKVASKEAKIERAKNP